VVAKARAVVGWELLLVWRLLVFLGEVSVAATQSTELSRTTKTKRALSREEE
jgi:hypothetical protein